MHASHAMRLSALEEQGDDLADHIVQISRAALETLEEILLWPESREISIKYSSKRMSPWRFSFQKRHYEMIAEMQDKLGEMYIILVCHDDGAVVLRMEEFQQVVKVDGEAAQWISAARSRRQMYLIKGSDGELEFKIGRDEFAEKIFGLTASIPESVERQALLR